jgi:tetratricopeptide (TPR) repeat protein
MLMLTNELRMGLCLVAGAYWVLTGYAPVALAETDVFTRYMEQAYQATQAGYLTEAINYSQQALPLAQDLDNKHIAQQNLGALHAKRGAYYQSQQQPHKGLADMREALYYLQASWPLGVPLTATGQQTLKQATIQYHQLLKQTTLEPLTPAYHVAQGQQLRSQGLFKPAIVEYQQGVKGGNQNPEVQVALADMYRLLNQPQWAVKQYKTGIAKTTNPTQKTDWSLRLANTLYKANQPEEAVALLNTILEEHPNNQTAINYLNAYWRSVLEQNPSNVLALGNLGALYQKQGNYQQAKVLYYQADQLANDDKEPAPLPTRIALRLNIVSLAVETNQLAEAKALVEGVLQANPSEIKALAYLLQIGQLQKGPFEALKAWQTAFESNQLPQTNDVLALFQSTVLNQPDKAQLLAEARWIETAIEAKQNPVLLQSFKQLASEALLATHPQEAITYLQSLPPTEQGLLLLVKAYQATNQPELALQAQQKATNLVAQRHEEQQVKPLLNQLYQLYMNKRYAESLAISKRLVEQDASLYMAWYYVGLNHDALQQPSKAREAYETCLTHKPSFAEGHYALGVLYRKLGEKTLASKAFSQFITLSEQKPKAEQALLKPQLTFAKKQVALLQEKPADASMSQSIGLH